MVAAARLRVPAEGHMQLCVALNPGIGSRRLHTPPLTHTRTRTRTHARTCTHAHTHTHTHTHSHPHPSAPADCTLLLTLFEACATVACLHPEPDEEERLFYALAWPLAREHHG
jgi:hypothetical protein